LKQEYDALEKLVFDIITLCFHAQLQVCYLWTCTINSPLYHL